MAARGRLVAADVARTDAPAGSGRRAGAVHAGPAGGRTLRTPGGDNGARDVAAPSRAQAVRPLRSRAQTGEVDAASRQVEAAARDAQAHRAAGDARRAASYSTASTDSTRAVAALACAADPAFAAATRATDAGTGAFASAATTSGDAAGGTTAHVTPARLR